jgi:8-oxo-dGTP pyrophosphatase MutT (NUDIX family)
MNLSFEATRDPTPPKDAATVLVLRDVPSPSGDHVEVYCVQRHAKSPFLGGAIVFPGGKVDVADGALAAELVSTPVHVPAWTDAPVSLLALAIAGARELVEEAGLFPGDISAEAAHALQDALRGKTALEVALRALHAEHPGARLDAARFVPFARWVTPAAEARRFDARFFLMRAPAGQEARPDERETTLGFWAPPARVLERFEAGDIQLAPPTTRCLELLVDARSTEEAFAIAAKQSLKPTCPLFVSGDPPFLALPGDPSHDERERTVEGPTRFVLRDGRFVSQDAPSPGA